MPALLTSPRLDEARRQRDAAVIALRAAADAIEDAGDDADLDALQETFDTAEAAVSRANTEVERLERVARARADNPAPDDPQEARSSADVRVGQEELYYRRDRPERSFLLDVARRDVRNDQGAAERLQRHGREMADEVARRQQRAERTFDAEMEIMLRGLPTPLRRALEERGVVERRGASRLDGAGGEFVPPLWLLDEYAEFARAGRPFANAIRNIPLPSGTDQINVPRIIVGSLTAMQNDGTVVTERDIETGSVQAPVRTVAGQQTIPLQMLDQSPVAFDELMFGDLLADHALRIDAQCLAGTGAEPEILGILNTAGIGTTTYTDATPTFPELWPKIWGAVDSIETTRKRSPEGIWFASRRYNWIVAQLDAQNRPFVVPTAQGPMNALALSEYPAAAEGPGLNIGGYNGWKDLTVPTNLGAGTNEDRIIVTRMSDHVLFEGAIQTRALKETKGDRLQVLLQVYSYIAATFGRFPAATNVVAGTGLTTPSF